MFQDFSDTINKMFYLIIQDFKDQFIKLIKKIALKVSFNCLLDFYTKSSLQKIS